MRSLENELIGVGCVTMLKVLLPSRLGFDFPVE
jgi:hypothetical protein